MENLFMVFMSVVSIMALFAVMVVFRDIIQEVLAARRDRNKTDRKILEHAERIIAAAEEQKNAPVAVAEPVAAPVVEEPVAEPVVEEPVAEEPAVEEVVAEEPVAEEAEDADGKISFSKGQQQTLDEKYLALTSEQKGWYDEIIKYASAVEGSKRFKNARYEEYKVGKNRLVRLLIKRGVINCEFILHNSDFKNYINENKIAVKQSATTMLVESAATVGAVKNSIDIVVAAIAEEKEYRKQQAREKRRAARAAQAAEKTEA
ncbi:MAG: hypothetical protein J6A84_04780 [Clostridia bacterium]|nr:hypothetical protein [Clostridia bacterium]